jgi:hypothetical protein
LKELFRWAAEAAEKRKCLRVKKLTINDKWDEDYE